MAATPSLLVSYEFPGALASGVCTNRFHFSGGTPASDSAWHTLMDAVVTAMKATLTDYCEITSVKGYTASSDIAASEKAYTTTGTYSSSGKVFAPGEIAMLLRWETAAKSSKGHPVYLFNYIHGVLLSSGSAAGAQQLDAGLVAAGAAFAQTWWNSGFSDGTNTYYRAGPNGATAVSRTVNNTVRRHKLTPR
jgi:hypothetical protein